MLFGPGVDPAPGGSVPIACPPRAAPAAPHCPSANNASLLQLLMLPTSRTRDSRAEYQREAASVQRDICHAFAGQRHPAASPRAIRVSHIPTGSHQNRLRAAEREFRTTRSHAFPVHAHIYWAASDRVGGRRLTRGRGRAARRRRDPQHG